MATYIRSVSFFSSLERTAFLSRGNTFTLETKRYVRGLRRKPVRVIFPEDETNKVDKELLGATKKKKIDVPVNTEKNPADKSDFRSRTSSSKAGWMNDEKRLTKTTSADVENDQFDGVRFERASSGDKRLARLVSVARSRTFREQQGKVLLEGRRLICDALNAGAVPRTVFFSTLERLQELPLEKLKRATLVKVKFEDIKLWSDLVAPQGVIGIFSRPDASQLSFAGIKDGVPLSLICDNIRDPGNLGTILRCAAAAGCHQVLLTKGCVDLWEPKVLRAAMGAHFHLPIHSNLKWEEVESHLPEDVGVHVADNRQNQEIDSSHKPSDFGWISTSRARSDARLEDSDSDSDDELSLTRLNDMAYCDDWARSPVALVVGGETHGLSLEALQLAEKRAGRRLFVPMVPYVDSLNSAMAASILLFEGRKQLLRATQSYRRKTLSNAGQHVS
ncbi:rRNA methyltransferase 3A, mitochondrial [Corythoichthys intestinalis]|uniref:rRNA methyltransferase 3A, mitochondrial n=1 Tax=Corythoichthys intestinalis TaxID=161448 RepID=UPI0025A52F3B|nr:rRNA methyltransferase 3A, mitochondrial [Corythoichthys intestinalis]XP_061797838.1 rRNA methyltransferase 3A, mitochondrial [Nerophis lumbriciformis]